MLSIRDLRELLEDSREDILGIDLAGSPRRDTGVAYFKGNELMVYILHSDEEILSLGSGFRYVFIDAPLSLPAGRNSIEEMSPYHLRECDQALKRLGVKFFPVTLGPMRMLTERGMRIAFKLRALGVSVFETLPGSVYDRFKIRRKNKDGIKGLYKEIFAGFVERRYTQDELDAIASLIIGMAFLKGVAIELNGVEGSIVIL